MLLDTHLADRAFSLGTSRVARNQARYTKQGNLSEGQRTVLSEAYPRVVEGVRLWIEHEEAKGRGRPSSAIAALQALGPERVAYAGLLGAFNCMHRLSDLRKVVRTIGSLVELELWGSDLRKTNPELYQRVFKKAKANSSRQAKIKSAKSIAAKGGYKVDRWLPRQQMYVGGVIFDIIRTACPNLFNIENEGKKEFVVLTSEALKAVTTTHEQLAWMKPIHMPMVAQPMPWKSCYTGCYVDRRLAKTVPLVRSYNRETTKVVQKVIGEGKAAKFLEAINTIQNVPLAINTRVLDVMEHCYEQGIPVEGLPRKDHIELLRRPEAWDALSDIEQKAWKLRAREVRMANRAIDADRVLVTRDIETARLLTEKEAFYLPTNVDFRGRAYPVPTFNYQRADSVKALFQLHVGKPLGASEGPYWLAIHLANCGDFEKVSKAPFEDRVKWVFDNEDMILSCAMDPLNDLRWAKADSPFMFLAACFVWFDYAFSGYDGDCVSHLPCFQDGSNSGLQHYSALLRSEDDGRMVNLVPDVRPHDVYAEVARRVKEAAEGDTNDIAKLFLAYGIDRKLVKRNVMTFPYSSNQFGFRAQHMEDLMKPLGRKVLLGELDVHPFGETWKEWGQAASYISKLAWKAVNETVVSAAEGMSFLKKVASLLASEGKPTTWVTPDGFPVLHDYRVWASSMVSLWFDDDRGVRRRYQIKSNDKPTKNLDKARQKSAVSPNFIHSLDACHLRMVVLKAKDEGLTDLMLIHDSFGTHACDMGRLGEIIRETFVALYQNNDPLGDVHAYAKSVLSEKLAKKLPNVPTQGTLRLEGVLKAPYAFA